MRCSAIHTAPVRFLSRMVLCCLIGTLQPVIGKNVIPDSALNDITFSQNLHASLPLELAFRDELGRPVVLRDYFHDKPVILVIGYYECPMLCSMTINGMVEALGDMKWSIGKDFRVIHASIDPNEKPPLALAKKERYLKRYGRPGAARDWHFLTGDDFAIKTLTRKVGFHYVYDKASKQFAHPSGLIFLTPDGKISGYLMGVSFSPGDVLSALEIASKRQVGLPVPSWVLLCFHYNPFTGKYSNLVIVAVRALAVLTMLGLAGFILLQKKCRTADPITQSVAGEEVDTRRG